MNLQAKSLISNIINQLKHDQLSNGSWHYAFDTGISTDAYMIILLRSLEINEEDLIQQLTKRILSKQYTDGSWKLFFDEKENVSPTVEAYYALLYSGYFTKKDEPLRKAKQFILANGGIEQSHIFTKIMLSLTGQTPLTQLFPIPIEMILLPTSFPINFYDISVFGRANIAPLMILSAKKFSIKTKKSPNMSDLFINRLKDFTWRKSRHLDGIISMIDEGIKSILGLPHQIHSLAIERAKQYMLGHIEEDGTLYSYFSATFLMIFALLSLGHSKTDPIIIKAIDGLKAMKCTIDGQIHMQYTTASVWNTSLISFALQNAGVSKRDPMVAKANQYLLEKQQTKYGDWAIHDPGVLPGGWGFSDINTFNPDVDDTTASLRAISRFVRSNSLYKQAWDRGTSWVISMQNSDGGWPAFEKDVDKKILKMIPIEGARFLLTDPSSADLTGRTLEFFGSYTKLSKSHQLFKRGITWLYHDQKDNGSWYGRWGICYIYGTWAAVTGLISAGVDPNNEAVQKAKNWLLSIQNKDGGWGESCKSDLNKKYIPLNSSNITQTAWALDALISIADQPTPEINGGIAYILNSYNKNDWTDHYPVGQGMGGGFYIHYHSYQYIFPLIALNHYVKKFPDNE